MLKFTVPKRQQIPSSFVSLHLSPKQIFVCCQCVKQKTSRFLQTDPTAITDNSI